MSFFKQRKRKEDVAAATPSSLKEKRILSFAETSTIDVYQKFLKKEITSINFDDLRQFPYEQRVLLSKGIHVQKVSETEDELILLCWMAPNSVLSGHLHPDFHEDFTIIFGELYDNMYQSRILKRNDTHRHPAGRMHEPCTKENKCFMIINARKI